MSWVILLIFLASCQTQDRCDRDAATWATEFNCH